MLWFGRGVRRVWKPVHSEAVVPVLSGEQDSGPQENPREVIASAAGRSASAPQDHRALWIRVRIAFVGRWQQMACVAHCFAGLWRQVCAAV